VNLPTARYLMCGCRRANAFQWKRLPAAGMVIPSLRCSIEYCLFGNLKVESSGYREYVRETWAQEVAEE
jgi:hypothetical protein